MFSFRESTKPTFFNLSILFRNRPCKHDGPCDSRSDCPCFVNKAHCRNTCRCAKTCAYFIHMYSCYFYLYFLFKFRPTKMERLYMCQSRKSMWDQEMFLFQSACRMWSRGLSFVWYKVRIVIILLFRCITPYICSLNNPDSRGKKIALVKITR